jgi:WD40 repeat protein
VHAVSAFQELADRLSGKTPKQQFDAVVGAERLWWQYCQGGVRAQPDWPAARERLSRLVGEQASSEDASRAFMAAIHATEAVAQALSGGIPDADGSGDQHLRPAMRYWADAGLLVPASCGPGQIPGRTLSGMDPRLRRRLRAVMRVSDNQQGSAAWAMVALTALRLAGVRPRRGSITRVPVLFDRTDTAGGISGVLEIREFPGGPAGLYPDPEAMSFTLADEEFTRALAAAWSYASRGRTADHCVMWRLTIEGDVPVHSIGGGSLAAAFAVALREHIEKRASLRRPWTPVRAAFLGLRPRCAITGAIASGDALAAVGGMEAKIEAARARNWRLVAPESNEAAVVHVPDGVHVYWAATLRQASRCARRWRPVRTSVAVLITCIAVVVFMTVHADQELVSAHAATVRTHLAFVDAHAAAVANQLIADSKETSTSDPILARLQAVAAWRIDPTDQARYAMRNVAALPQAAILDSAFRAVNSVAFSRDGKTLAAAADNPEDGDSGGVQLWDVADRQPLGSPLSDSGFDNILGRPVAFSPGAAILAVSTGEATVDLWDETSRRQIAALVPSGGEFTRVAAVQFSPDGALLAIGMNDGTVRLWDVAQRRQLGTPIVLTHDTSSDDSIELVTTMAFSSDGKTLTTVTASDSGVGTVEVWNVATHHQVGRPFGLPGPTNLLPALAFSPDGTTAAVGSQGVQLWDVLTGKHIASLESPADRGMAVNAVAFSPDGQTLAIGNSDGTTEIWNVATRKTVGPLLTSAGAVESIAFSPNGQTLATGNDDGTVHLWNAAFESPFTGSQNVGSVAFDPGSRILAAIVPDHPGQLQLWNTVTGRRAGTVSAGDVSGIGSAAFSPDGKTLAAGSRDGTVQVWDVATRRRIGHVPYSGSTQGAPPGASLAFGPDGRILAIASFDGTAQLWNVATQRLVGTFSADSENVEAVAINPNGRLLVTGAYEGTTRFWNIATHRQVAAPLYNASPVDAMAFSPDGTILAEGYDNGAVRLWNLASHQLLGAFLLGTGNHNPVEILTFSPDGTTLAARGNDGTTQLWDVPTQQAIGAPFANPGHNGAVGTLAFSPDGETLIDGTESGTELWHVAYLVNAVPYLCEWTGRSLTPAEWTQYAPGLSYRKICS